MRISSVPNMRDHSFPNASPMAQQVAALAQQADVQLGKESYGRDWWDQHLAWAEEQLEAAEAAGGIKQLAAPSAGAADWTLSASEIAASGATDGFDGRSGRIHPCRSCNSLKGRVQRMIRSSADANLGTSSFKAMGKEEMVNFFKDNEDPPDGSDRLGDLD